MIQNLILNNFKCFDNLELELKPLTLITGINGMGKSSIIQALLMLRQSYDTKFLEAQGKVLLNGELVKLVNGNAIRYAISDSPVITISFEFESDKIFVANIEAGSKDENLICKINTSEVLSSYLIYSNADIRFNLNSAEK